jgi:hypothetical protein
MGGIYRLNAPDPLEDFLDSADEIYGTGLDGNVTISTNTTLTSDMFYENLTIATGVTLNTGGYRVFVRNLLMFEENSVIGLPGGSVVEGSIKGGATATNGVTNSLGGDGFDGTATTTATRPTADVGGSAYYYYAAQAIKGYSITANTSNPEFLRGGAGGDTGEGGGVVIVAARYIGAAGAAQIAATGGSNAGGGVIICVSSGDVLNGNVTLNVGGQGLGSSGTAIYLEVD